MKVEVTVKGLIETYSSSLETKNFEDDIQHLLNKRNTHTELKHDFYSWIDFYFFPHF